MPGKLDHHLRPPAAADILRKGADGRYAISGPARKAPVAVHLLTAQVYHDRHSEQFERDRDAKGDTRHRRCAAERSTDVPVSEEGGPAGDGP